VQEATTFLYQYEKKKTDLTSEVGQHGYMIPTQLLHEQEALATRTPETTDIAYEANTNALLHYLESTPVISKITSYPLPFEHLREIVSNSGYQQMNQQELGTLLTYIPLRKEHSHRLEEVTVTVRGKNKTTSLATLPSATEVLS